ncbi:MAG: FkbM family methyltransferase [Candidatus Solibacter usitatus]|nr:FkbM family methyltransferase [Candidatus Solibacter usitatus]
MKRILVVLSLVLVALGVALAVSNPLRHWALAQAGRGNGCSPARAWAIEAEKRELTRVKDEILSRTRLLEKEHKGLELYATPYGKFWAPEGSRYILPFNLAEQATHIYGEGERFVRKGDVVLDCGANVGTFARFALNAGARLVVAIEPAPDNLECLRRNFAPEVAEKRLVIYPKGVWDKDDTLEFLVDPDNQAADSFVIHRQGAKAVARLPLTTIDKLASELALDRVDFIKMDIEGAEVKALQGAKETIGRYHPRMALSVYHQDDHPVEVPKAARAAWPGYQVECGPCNAVPGAVRADVMYFQ